MLVKSKASTADFKLGNIWDLSLNVPYSGCSDDSQEKDTTPAERMRGLEDEDVLEEERVQLGQL